MYSWLLRYLIELSNILKKNVFYTETVAESVQPGYTNCHVAANSVFLGFRSGEAKK